MAPAGLNITNQSYDNNNGILFTKQHTPKYTPHTFTQILILKFTQTIKLGNYKNNIFTTKQNNSCVLIFDSLKLKHVSTQKTLFQSFQLFNLKEIKFLKR